MENLVKLKIAPENTDGSLLSDDEFIFQKKDILVEEKTIKEKIGDTDQSKQNWFDNCVDYFNFTCKLKKRFKIASPEQKREIFKFVCYNPIITNKILLTEQQNPNNLIIQFKEDNPVIITKDFALSQQKKPALDRISSEWRTVRDLNP